MITRDDFDACHFPKLRRQLTTGLNALYECVSGTWDERQLEAWKRILVPRDCPLCGSSRNESDIIVTKHGVDIVRCRECSMVYSNCVSQGGADLFTFTNPRTSASFIEYHEATAYRELARRKFEYYLQEAERFSMPGTLLDIGCCGGEFIETARSCGWTAAGIDASEHFVERARSKGFYVRAGLFPDTVELQPCETYRMISLLDVLEHLRDPVGSLQTLRPHLQEGGVLLIQVPNFDSPLQALQGAGSRNYAFSHWSHFTASTLAAAAEKAGFRTLKIQTVITEIDHILAFPRDAIECAIRSAVGDDVLIPSTIDADWLHKHLLGYKLFGLFSPA